MDPQSHLLKATEEESLEQQWYQSLVGSLIYLSVCTRPDLAYAVSTLVRFSSKLNRSHCMDCSQTSPEVLEGNYQLSIVSHSPRYSDAGDQEDRRSTSGYIFKMAGGPISWKSRRKHAGECCTVHRRS